jgi:hypothetical protein
VPDKAYLQDFERITMKTSHEKVLNALSGLIPEDAQAKVAEAVKAMLDEAIAELDSEYDAKLKETYAQVEAEKETAVQTAEKGYAEAWEIILDQRHRMETLKEEYQAQLEEGYEEAFAMLQQERSKNDTLEVSCTKSTTTALARSRNTSLTRLTVPGKKGEEFFDRQA